MASVLPALTHGWSFVDGPVSEATVPEASYRSAFEADFIRSKLLQALEKIELAQKMGNWPPRGATKRRLSPLSPNFDLAEGKEPIQPRKLPAGISTAISKEELEKIAQAMKGRARGFIGF
ncbi:hypothetical protein AAVH_05963 [Aphelenchoides avenae]|nr:hypothetical protein AAVH_05963 [Aphelenchus avenae]